jgi:MinD superfamily P-loop ATPase
MGRLRVGEAMSPPLMRSVKSVLSERLPDSRYDILVDSPPGVSCPAVNAVMDSDVILLVTEPTPFGLYDLQLAFEAFSPLGKPMAVVINREGIGHQEVNDFCRSVHLPIVAQIPYRREIAESYANGRIIADGIPDIRTLFTSLVDRVKKLAIGNEETANA